MTVINGGHFSDLKGFTKKPKGYNNSYGANPIFGYNIIR